MPSLIKIPSENMLTANGNLSYLTKVEGTGMMKKLIELLSVYNAGKEFVNNTESFDVLIKEETEGKAKVVGNINFKEDKRPTNELIRLLIKGDLL